MRLGKAAAATAIAIITVGAAVGAFADDTIHPDGDWGAQGSGPITYGDGGHACADRGQAVEGRITVNYNGNNDNAPGLHHFALGEPLSVTFDNAPSGVTITATATSVPTNWNDNSDSFYVPISTTVASTVADGHYNIDVTVRGTQSTYTAGDSGGNGKPQVGLDITCTTSSSSTTSSTPTNVAPTVSKAAADANGTEGDTLQTDGAFTDADSDTLTLTASPSNVGTFTDNGDGTWTWSLGTNDDVASASITVTADDGHSHTATDTFDYAAANADPSVGTVTVTPTGACSASVSASFTDAGTADTHTATVSWSAGGTPEAASVTETNGSGTASSNAAHTYASDGTYAVTVAVTDDDGGTGSNAGSFATKLTASNFLAPINTGAGQRSVFKLGSTIPVKITVANCAGAAVSTLTPLVQLAKIDNVADGTVNEAQINETPTNGKNMRWDGTQYIYNLSTKNSQFNSGAALTAGTYRLWVTDSSFYQGTNPAVVFDLK